MVQVARSRSRLRKLWTGPPFAVSLLERLRSAAGEDCAGATIEARWRAAPAGSSSSNSMGLRHSRMCHSTWQASMHRKTWARTRDASQWWIGRRCRSTVLRLRKARSTLGEALIGADHALGRQGFVLDAGADDIKAVEPGLLGDAEGTAGKGKAVFTDSDVEQLGEFVAVFGAADRARDPVGASGAGAAGDLVGRLGQRRLGGSQ